MERFAYGTYGELLSDVKNSIRFLYNGAYGVTTDENGLYYMRARYYNSDIKRFINQDIKVGDIGNSQGLNRYAYCEGNPVNMADPFGLSPMGMDDIRKLFDVHDVLGVIGFAGNFVGGVGVLISIVCDVADAVIYFKEGEPLKDAISLVCAIPGIGDIIGAVRHGTKLAKTAKIIGNTIRMAQKMYVTTESARTAIELAGNAKIEYDLNGGEMTSSVKGKLFGAAAMVGLAVVSGKSLARDVGNLSKAAEVHFKTRNQQTTDAVTGKNIQYEGVGGCFVAGTQVKTKEGGRNIEDVKAGDFVLSENPETGI